MLEEGDLVLVGFAHDVSHPGEKHVWGEEVFVKFIKIITFERNIPGVNEYL
jgi:hypothetical protein